LAFNAETFKTRAITAFFFVLVMLSGLFLHAWLFYLLLVVIMLGGIYEFARINKIIYGQAYLFQMVWALPYIVLPMMLLADLGVGLKFTGEGWPGLHADNYSPLYPCAVIFSIWINDTMAYLVGSFIGKTPFSKISPKKTWEGTIGGVILCMIVIALLGTWIEPAKAQPWHHWLAIAGICAVFGTAGDLLESKLKRMAGIKDSGHFMPGHGGFLDRFDSLLLAVPPVWVYLKLLA